MCVYIYLYIIYVCIIYIYIYTGAKSIKIFAVAKMSVVSEGSFVLAAGKSSASPICINCIGKMLLWGHVPGIIELLLNNHLGHFLIIEKKNCFSFHIKCNKDNTLLHANIQMPWCPECNQSNQQCPKCFYKPESPVTTSKSG